MAASVVGPCERQGPCRALREKEPLCLLLCDLDLEVRSFLPLQVKAGAELTKLIGSGDHVQGLSLGKGQGMTWKTVSKVPIDKNHNVTWTDLQTSPAH